MLVGKTGGGKSSSANMILGRHVFSTSDEFCSDTSDCRMESVTLGDLTVQVMDTPGLFDTSKSHEELGLVIVRCVIDLHPGPHVIFIVFRIGTRYTEEEFAAYRRLKVLFGSKVTQHMVALFTGGDKLKKSGKTIEQFLLTAPDSLRTVSAECGGRYAVLNNELDFAEGQAQVKALLDKVEALNARNEKTPYVCNNYSRIGKSLDDVESLKREVGHKMREVEAQEVKAMKYIQEREAEYREKLDQLNLTHEEYRRRQEQFEKEMEDEYQKKLAEWEREKAAEERQMEARRAEQERQMQRELKNYKDKLMQDMEDLKKKLEEEHKRNAQRLQQERDEHQSQMDRENEALGEKLREVERKLRDLNDKEQRREQTRLTDDRYKVWMDTLGTVATLIQGVMDNSSKQESNELALALLSKMMDLQVAEKRSK
ncbi:uncharacterized protein [Littorina saxatilis]|uniref:AIG1-type G domain-containing protein n=1 Tax=Littorina saxatilis TaxID=31220 RepID=A0AAN9AL33_9CAEN